LRKKKNSEVKITDVKYPNISIGQDQDGNTVEFKGGVLGQTCKVKITRNRKIIKRKYIELLEILRLKIVEIIVRKQIYVGDVLTKNFLMKQN